MSRVTDRLGAIRLRGHVSDTRLSAIAQMGSSEPHELAHLASCGHCRSLVVGFSRTEEALVGPRAQQKLPREGEGPANAFLRHGRPGRANHPARYPWARGAVIPVAAAAVLVGVVATAGLLALRGAGQPGASAPGSSWMPVDSYETALIVRLSLGESGRFSWAPDGKHLLVLDTAGSRVYDRSGVLVSTFGPNEGWIDAEHLIDGDGHVYALTDSFQPKTDKYPWYGPVVAGGHGSAAIIVSQPACVGDPMIAWYRNGNYARTPEKASPLGWSPDARFVLLGHLDCSTDPSTQIWRGPVDVVDFASGKTVAIVPSVSGRIAFNPAATRLAAESGNDLRIVDFATGEYRTVPEARLLGWSDDDRVYCRTTSGSIALVGATTAIDRFSAASPRDWAIASPTGPKLIADSGGKALRVVVSDENATLLDLVSADLAALPGLRHDVSGPDLELSPWSPDGQMLVLESSDGTYLSLFAIDPARSGAVGTALPTPVGSPGVLVELHRTTLPAAATAVVADTKRNAFWFLSGWGSQAGLYRFDVGTSAITRSPIAAVQPDPNLRSLAIDPDGRLWVGGESGIVVYDPETGGQTSVALPGPGASAQPDPGLGRPDPWVSGIAFDAHGNALIARNWVRSLLRVDKSLAVMSGEIDVSDGFPMTGGVAVAGGMAYVLADRSSGLVFGVDASGSGKLFNTKMIATSIAACGDKLLSGGMPPGLRGPDGGEAMIEPLMPSADVVGGGAGTCALYDNASGMLQFRGLDGHVTGQAVFAVGATPKHIASIVFDAEGRAWALETTDGGSALARLDVA